jgi:hypothetical protein
MRVPKPIAIAVGTAVVATGVAHSVMPGRDALTPAGQQQEQVRQLDSHQRRIYEERRRKGIDLGYAVQRDELRSREVRRKEADSVLRVFLERRP